MKGLDQIRFIQQHVWWCAVINQLKMKRLTLRGGGPGKVYTLILQDSAGSIRTNLRWGYWPGINFKNSLTIQPLQLVWVYGAYYQTLSATLW